MLYITWSILIKLRVYNVSIVYMLHLFHIAVYNTVTLPSCLQYLTKLCSSVLLSVKKYSIGYHIKLYILHRNTTVLPHRLKIPIWRKALTVSVRYSETEETYADSGMLRKWQVY